MQYDPYNNYDPYNYGGMGFAGGMTLGEYTARTYLWMVVGLLVTFAVAIGSWITGFTFYSLAAVPMVHILCLIGTLALSIFMAVRIQKMRVGTAIACFVGYSVLLGFTLSIYLLVFDVASLILVFGATALYFGALSAYGHFTKRDLSSIRSILMSGLIFLIIFGILSLFIPGLAFMDQVVCIIGIAVFLGFTAYDTQKIRTFYQYYAGYPDMLAKASIFSALQLYLDFINLFLYLLRFIGNRRN